MRCTKIMRRCSQKQGEGGNDMAIWCLKGFSWKKIISDRNLELVFVVASEMIFLEYKISGVTTETKYILKV